MIICDLCIWDCREENAETCEYFSPITADESAFDFTYVEYINDAYEEFMKAYGFHTDDEWYLDPQ